MTSVMPPPTRRAPREAETAASVACRLIEERDLASIVRLLRRGFSDRTEAYWWRGFSRHASRAKPAGYPTYGFMLDQGGQPVGVLLTLFTSVPSSAAPYIRCNLSSWYVEPSFRLYGGILEKAATRWPDVSYFNVSPAPHTTTFQEARGYERYCHGQFIALPALSKRRDGARAFEVHRDESLGDFAPYERELIRDHLDYGCIVILALDDTGCLPFIFQRRTVKLSSNATVGRIRCFQLVYCRGLEDLSRCAGPIGRVLLRRYKWPWIVVDSTGPIPGLVGRYFPGRAPKYRRGPTQVALGDLAYTELVLFGP